MPNIHYIVEGDGKPLTLIHGVGANLHNWDRVVERMRDRYRILRLDMRGHGESGEITPECTLESFVDDVCRAMDLAGFEKTDLAGFSLGGMVAQLFAVTYPERVEKLALLSAVAGRTPEERERLRKRSETIKNEGVGAVLGNSKTRWFTEDFIKSHPEVVEKRIQEMRDNNPAWYAEAYRIFATSEVGDRIHEIPHKTLVATGEFDEGSNPRMSRFMHEQINDSKLIIIPKMRHSILMEAPDMIADMLLDFLDE